MNNLYIIILFNKEKVSIQTGKLGLFTFFPGYYFYVGSAKRNLTKRIQRHISKDKKFHWHIDYIRDKMQVVKVVAFKEVEFTECELAQGLKKEFDLLEPYNGIGSSDCKCKTHLFTISSRV